MIRLFSKSWQTFHEITEDLYLKVDGGLCFFTFKTKLIMRTFEKRGSKTNLLRLFKKSSEKSFFYPYYGAGLYAVGDLGTPCKIWCNHVNLPWETGRFLAYHGIPTKVWEVFELIYKWESIEMGSGAAEPFPAKTPLRFVRSIKVGVDLQKVVENLIQAVQARYGWDSTLYPGRWYQDHIQNENYSIKILFYRLTNFPGLGDLEFREFLIRTFFKLLGEVPAAQ